MLSEHISGDNVVAAEMRCSTVMVTAPPVVMFTIASQLCLMRGRNCMKMFGSGLGRPSLGSRACRCRMAAPAWAASIACSAIWSGVIGNASDMVGVWIEPVTAQVMITLLDFSAIHRLHGHAGERGGGIGGGGYLISNKSKLCLALRCLFGQRSKLSALARLDVAIYSASAPLPEFVRPGCNL